MILPFFISPFQRGSRFGHSDILSINFWTLGAVSFRTIEGSSNTLDQETFLKNNTRVPNDTELRTYLGIESIERGKPVPIQLLYDQEHYDAYFLKERKKDSNRINLKWYHTIANILRERFPEDYLTVKRTKHTKYDPVLILTKPLEFDPSNPTFIVHLHSLSHLKQIETDLENEEESFEEISRSEGKKIIYTGSRYERNPVNRAEAIRIHGLCCKACGFNFEDKYGDLGKDYIEVHHIKPISSYNGEIVKINPKIDLIPLCSNCHKMIHRLSPQPRSVEELQIHIKQAKQKRR